MQDVSVRCRSCGHGYAEHDPTAGGCTAPADPGLGEAAPCRCEGFRWVPVDGPSVGSYREAPLSRRP